MNDYDERLKQLREQMASKNRLETRLKDLRKQEQELSARVDAFESMKLKEEADVAHLEGRSLVHLFHKVTGKLDEVITDEKREAYEAAVKYDAVYAEWKAVQEDIRSCELELGRVRRSDEEYQAVLRAKKDAMKLAGSTESTEILSLEEKIARLEAQEKEVEEAIFAGQSADQIAENILSHLSSADGYATWDMWGGGLIADVAKYGHLDDAQDQVEQLQVALRRFKTELADIAIDADMQVSIDGFLRFADFFFDGLFANWAVKERISGASFQVKDVQRQIEDVLNKLSSMRTALQAELLGARQRMNEVVSKGSFE